MVTPTRPRRYNEDHFQKLADSFKITSQQEEFESPNDTYDEFIGKDKPKNNNADESSSKPLFKQQSETLLSKSHDK